MESTSRLSDRHQTRYFNDFCYYQHLISPRKSLLTTVNDIRSPFSHVTLTRRKTKHFRNIYVDVYSTRRMCDLISRWVKMCWFWLPRSDRKITTFKPLDLDLLYQRQRLTFWLKVTRPFLWYQTKGAGPLSETRTEDYKNTYLKYIFRPVLFGSGDQSSTWSIWPGSDLISSGCLVSYNIQGNAIIS